MKHAIPRIVGVTCVAVVAGILAIAPARAAIEYDQDVTPDIIFGSGNSNGSFTTDRDSGIELGLRAKIPFVGTTNSNGDGTYSYSFAEQDAGGSPGRWNFDWTVNTDYDGSSGLMIDGLTYLLRIDFDPSVGTNFLEFDPITPSVSAPFFDHSIGTNATSNGGGTEAGDAGTYATLIANNNVLQQSWRHAFFPVHPSLTYDPDVDGTYTIELAAFFGDDEEGFTELARSSIDVIIGAGGAIPEPAALAVWLGLATCFATGFRRRR